MTSVLTRIFRRSKSEPDPDYLPPYFWHRYYVWRFLIAIPAFVLLMRVLDLHWAERGFVWDISLSFMTALFLHPVPYFLRRQWVTAEGKQLGEKLDRWAEYEHVSHFEIGEAKTQYLVLAQDLKNYAFSSASPLSIHRLSWEGNGSRYVVYQMNRQKRVFTFYHD